MLHTPDPSATPDAHPASDTASFSSPVESLIDAALNQLKHLPPRSYELQHKVAKRALDAAMIAEAAERRGLDVLRLNRQTEIISDGGFAVGFYQNMSSPLTALDRQLTNDKLLTKRALAHRGLPVARGAVVGTYADALAAMEQIGPPVVVKPIVGSGGKGVTVDIRDADELRAAAEDALSRARRILVEEMVAGIDLRVMTVAGKAVAAMLRVPANVIGDGTSTIRELIDQKNELRSSNAYLRHCPILINSFTEHHLSLRGMTPDSVPADGRRVFLHYKANLSSGGDSYELIDVVHPEILRLAERAAACIPSAYHAGIDVLLERFDAPPDQQRCILCEINLNNEMPIHIFPLYGEPVDTGDETIEGYFLRARESIAAGAHRLDLTAPTAGGPGGTRSDDTRSDGTALSSTLSGVAPVLAGMPLAAPAAAASTVGTPGTDSTPGADGTPGTHGTPGTDHHAGTDGTPRTDGGERTPRRLDQHHLGPALQDAGLDEVRFQGRLIHGVRDGHDIVLERSGMTMFAAALGENVPAMYALASAAGLPVLPWARFPRENLTDAQTFVATGQGPWKVQPALRESHIRRRFRVRDAERLAEVWGRLQSTTREVFLEQVPRGLACTVLVVGGQVRASVLLTPFGVTGDGRQTLGALIEEKLAARAEHPYLRHLPVKPSVLTDKNLERKKLHRDHIPAAGRAVWLARSPLTEVGPDTFGFSGCPYPEPAELADQALRLIGHRSVASVTCVRDGNGDDAAWVVHRVDPDPVLALFAFPWAGETGPIYSTVADELLAGQHYTLPR
ncbi:ATP-binding protein [Phytoactinopolyspora halotolerans]|uniref:ATP-grasp domain-containing protein n=1 Tax=Phytoactinopolyspora halotolerans TaxID=1981512 RepID=A0A6L9SG90_9ACTN|nr:ATP-grasp domain-containing protein [Phytoactinopolyspora halotolerans]NEE04087.1 ATP-grasp domain-containing protein [Phytoactinopolyspora halotolerans]